MPALHLFAHSLTSGENPLATATRTTNTTNTTNTPGDPPTCPLLTPATPILHLAHHYSPTDDPEMVRQQARKNAAYPPLAPHLYDPHSLLGHLQALPPPPPAPPPFILLDNLNLWVSNLLLRANSDPTAGPHLLATLRAELDYLRRFITTQGYAGLLCYTADPLWSPTPAVETPLARRYLTLLAETHTALLADTDAAGWTTTYATLHYGWQLPAAAGLPLPATTDHFLTDLAYFFTHSHMAPLSPTGPYAWGTDD